MKPYRLKPYRHEESFSAVRAVYGRQPSTAHRSEILVSTPHSIDFAFIGHERTLVRVPGRPTYPRNIPAGTGGMHGCELLEFVDVNGSSEYLELSPTREIRTEAAEYFRVPERANLDEIQDLDDQVLWSVSARFRAHAMGGWPMDELEAEVLTRTLVGHLMCDRLGGRRPRINDARLSASVLSKLKDYIEASICEPISVNCLAELSQRSPHHFMRTFALTTGMKPHEYVRAIRMERAKEALLSGATVASTARAVGYAPGHSFRKAFQRYFGVYPSALVTAFR